MYNPTDLDEDALQSDIDLMEEQEKQMAEAARAEQEAALQQKEEEEEEKKGNSGSDGLQKFGDALKSGAEAIGQATDFVTDPINTGIARGLNGVFTLPERTFDLATGEIERQEEENGEYVPDWDPFKEESKLPDNANWWQQGTAAFTSAAVEAAPAALLTGGASLPIQFTAGTALDTLANQDAATKDMENLANLASETFPWAAPYLKNIQINEEDSPMVKTVKGILENMMFLGTAEALGKLFGRGKRAIDDLDIEEQRLAKAAEEIEEDAARYRTGYQLEGQRALPEGIEKVEVKDVTDELAEAGSEAAEGTFRAAKNSPLADPGQGKYNSRSSTEQQFSNRKRQVKNNEDMGTAGYSFTPAQAERMSNQNGITQEWMENKAKELYGSQYYKDTIGRTQSQRNSWYESNKEIFARFQEMMGRWNASMDPDTWWADQFKRQANTGGSTPKGYWATNDVLLADLINAELFQAIRNRGMAALELGENFDLMDTDGPMQAIAQQLTMGLAQVRRSRYVMSDEFKALGNKQGKQVLDEKMAEFTQESRDSIEGFFRYVKEQPDDELAKQAAQLFAKSDINTFPDIGAYLQSKFKRGDFGKYGEGTAQLGRDFNVLTMLSQLSAPKTLMKAFKGTVEIGFDNMVGQGLSSIVTGDFKATREVAAKMGVIRDIIPDFFRVFNKNWDAWWNKDMASLGNRYNPKTNPEQDALFDLFYDYEMTNGNFGDKVYATTMKFMRDASRWQGFSYPFAGLSTIDEMGGVVLAKARAKELAVREALENKKWYEPIDKKAMDEAYNNYLSATMDDAGDIDFNQDLFLKAGYQETTLTKPLTGPFAALDRMVADVPAMGVFYRFMTTGVNSIAYNYKKVPIVGLAHKEFVDITRTLADGDLKRVAKYGISSKQDLKTAAQIWAGRNAIGAMTVGMLLQKKQNNQLNGNGPRDYAQVEAWKRAGWQARTLYQSTPFGGDIGVSLDGFDTFNLLAYMVSDVIDNRNLMGDEWADQNLATIGFTVAASMTSKSMLSGLNNFMKFLNGDQDAPGKVIGDIANSTAPWAGLRSSLGRMLKPGLMEVNSGIIDSIRNRNRGFEGLAGEDQLQQKVDLLYGTNLSPWDYAVNAFNQVSPISVDWRADRPGRDLLVASGYPLRLVTYNYKNINLEKERIVRGMFSEAISRQGLGKKLDKLAKDPVVLKSMQRMREDQENGIIDSRMMSTYQHLRLIKQRIESAKEKAWAEISEHPDVQALIDAKKEKDIRQNETLSDTRSQTEALINWTNK